MIVISGNYKDCRGFIHYSNGNSTTGVTIVSHNKEYMTISVKGQFRESEGNEFVMVLILLDNSVVHEYRGKLRRSPADHTSAEIALFKGQLRESRSSRRYPINAPAVVESLITENGKLPLPTAAEVFLSNLSSTGALLQAAPGSFSLNSTLEIKLNISAAISIIHGKVVRIRSIDDTSTEYGCALVSAY